MPRVSGSVNLDHHWYQRYYPKYSYRKENYQQISRGFNYRTNASTIGKMIMSNNQLRVNWRNCTSYKNYLKEYSRKILRREQPHLGRTTKPLLPSQYYETYTQIFRRSKDPRIKARVNLYDKFMIYNYNQKIPKTLNEYLNRKTRNPQLTSQQIQRIKRNKEIALRKRKQLLNKKY